MTMIGNLRYTPYAASDNLTTFIIRPATVFEKVQFEAEIGGSPYYAAEPRSWAYAEAIDDFVAKTLTGEALVGAQEAIIAVRNDVADDDQVAVAEAVEAKARLYHKPYRDLIDQATRRQNYIPFLATKKFLVGWENRKDADGNDIPFTLENGSVSDDSLSTLASHDMLIVGLTAFKFMHLSESERKNLISELLYTPAPATSISPATTDLAAGTSVKNTTTRTRNSKSRKTAIL